jgi:hypothetical protein
MVAGRSLVRPVCAGRTIACQVTNVGVVQNGKHIPRAVGPRLFGYYFPDGQEGPPYDQTTERTASMSDRRQLRSPGTAVPIFRIVSLLVMLAVIGLTIYNLHQRATVGGVAQGEPQRFEAVKKTVAGPRGTEEVVGKTPSIGGTLSRQPPPSPSITSPAKNGKPVADRDPEQWKQFQRRAEAILDKSTSIHGYEMPAYWRVMDWVESQSLADFEARSLPQVPFQNFLQHPAKYRGRPVRVALEIHRVLSVELDGQGKDGRPKKLYELWGFPTELDGWWYVVVTPELPPGFPLGKEVEATTTVYGYFFKLQGYQPFDAKLDSRPLVAPLIIGRVAPVTVVPIAAPWNPLSIVVLVVGGVILLAVVGGWIIAAGRRRVSPAAASFGLPDTMDDATLDADAPTGVENE